MHIILLCGIWDRSSQDCIWREFVAAIQKEFPHARITLMRRPYGPLSKARMRTFIRDVVEAHDNGDDVLLIGHSMGGIVALAAAEKFVRSRVRAIVTIFSPRGMLGGLFGRLAGARSPCAPLITFQAIPDRMIPLPHWSRHPLSFRHTRFFTDHLWGLEWKSAEIARIIRETLSHLEPD